MRLLNFFLTIVFIISFCECKADDSKTFILQGNVKNFKKGFFEFGTTGYFKSPKSSIIVDNKGNFSRRIFIDGVQDIGVMLNNQLIKFFASPGDVITMNWNDNEFENTFNLYSPSKLKNHDLKVSLAIHKHRYKPFLDLYQNLTTDNTLADSTKYRLINESFNIEVAIILREKNKNYDNAKLWYDTYFKHALLISKRLKGNYQLQTNKTNIYQKYIGLNDKYFSEDCFRLCPQYRDFLFDKVRATGSKDSYSANAAGTLVYNPAKSEFNKGKSIPKGSSIRDWFFAKSLIVSFEHYKYEDVKSLYDEFTTNESLPSYIDTVKTFYKTFSKLKPGLPAPVFSLKDLNDKVVSLSDFKGKLIYIDFWGVYCGPCLGDIKENAEKVHKKYSGKDIVFINVCVDETGKSWKDKIASLKLEGVNLVAEGRTKNPVSIDYNINGIPHYVLIDKKGNLIDNNAPALFQLVIDNKNIIDKALEL